MESYIRTQNAIVHCDRLSISMELCILSLLGARNVSRVGILDKAERRRPALLLIITPPPLGFTIGLLRLPAQTGSLVGNCVGFP